MPQVRPTMRDKELERRFRRDGYVIVPCLSPDEVQAGLDAFASVDSGIGEGYYASIHSESSDYKRETDRLLTERLWPALDRILADHRCLIAAFMVKPPSGSTVVPVHQDWNTMEEGENAGITCWMPLTPVTDLEGRMQVLPGSHQYLRGLRGSPGFPAPYQSISDRIRDELMVTLEVRVGDVLVMDGRVLHTTGQNESGRERIAAYVNALPAEAPSLHWYRNPDDGTVEGYWVDRQFFTSFNIGERPPGSPFRTIEGYVDPEFDMEELQARMRRHQPRRAFGRRHQPRVSA